MMQITSNSQTSVSDTVSYPGAGQGKLQLEIPTVIGVGLMYNHDNKIKVGVDYTLQKWGDVDAPSVQNNNGTISYVMTGGQYKNRHKVTAGVDYCPDYMGRHFLTRLHYKAGVSYATPYYYIYSPSGAVVTDLKSLVQVSALVFLLSILGTTVLRLISVRNGRVSQRLALFVRMFSVSISVLHSTSAGLLNGNLTNRSLVN